MQRKPSAFAENGNGINVEQPGAAEELRQNKALFEMVTYGIIRGDEDGAYHLEEKVTRSEGAAVMNRLRRVDVSVIGADAETKFSDVSKDDWFFADVYWAQALGIMDGYPDSTFRPDEFLNYEAFSKMLICALGYRYAAEEAAGTKRLCCTGTAIGDYSRITVWTRVHERTDGSNALSGI